MMLRMATAPVCSCVVCVSRQKEKKTPPGINICTRTYAMVSVLLAVLFMPILNVRKAGRGLGAPQRCKTLGVLTISALSVFVLVLAFARWPAHLYI